jgi:hypothetical protein
MYFVSICEVLANDCMIAYPRHVNEIIKTYVCVTVTPPFYLQSVASKWGSMTDTLWTLWLPIGFYDNRDFLTSFVISSLSFQEKLNQGVTLYALPNLALGHFSIDKLSWMQKTDQSMPAAFMLWQVCSMKCRGCRRRLKSSLLLLRIMAAP